MTIHYSNLAALFLDRDGVICEALPRGQYLVSHEQFRLMPGIRQLVERMRERGVKVFVATNQPQVAKGLLAPETLAGLHETMRTALGGAIEKIYVCPHRDEDRCPCRKPKPGMLLQALRDYALDPRQCIMVGDSDKDVRAGAAAGMRTVFVKNAHNADELARCAPDHAVAAIAELNDLLD